MILTICPCRTSKCALPNQANTWICYSTIIQGQIPATSLWERSKELVKRVSSANLYFMKSIQSSIRLKKTLLEPLFSRFYSIGTKCSISKKQRCIFVHGNVECYNRTRLRLYSISIPKISEDRKHDQMSKLIGNISGPQFMK